MGVSDRRKKIRRQSWLAFALVVLAGLSVLAGANALRLRWDWTEEKVYTLSDATRKVLAALDEPVFVRAYITRDLPQPYGRLRRFIADMLAVYHDAAGAKFQYEIVDPADDPEDAARLAALGIPKVQVQVIENDRAQIKQGYLALVIEYLDRKETIPIVQDEQGFEYLLTRKIKKVTGKGKKKVRFAVAPGADGELMFDRLERIAGDDYDFGSIDPTQQPIPEDVSVLIVPAPSKKPDALWRWRVQQFWLRGGGLLIFAANAKPAPGDRFSVVPVDPYANDWLREDYHLIVDPGVVMDEQAGRVVVEQQQGIYLLRSVVDDPFFVVASEMNRFDPVVRKLKAVWLPYAAPLVWEGGERMHRRVLMRSSSKAAVQDGPPFDVNPLVPIKERFAGLQRRQVALALIADGKAESSWRQPPEGVTEAERKAARKRAEDARLIVVGSSSCLHDPFLQQDNLLFALNALDWLARDEGLIALRSRGSKLRPLPPLSDDARTAWKGIWMWAPAVLVALVGVIRLRRPRREKGA